LALQDLHIFDLADPFFALEGAKVVSVVYLAVMIALRSSLLLAVNFFILLGCGQSNKLFNIVLLLVNATSSLDQGLVINLDRLLVDDRHE